MNPVFWMIVLASVVILAALAILVFAAARASRSKPRGGQTPADTEQTPTQKVENPYRKFYKKITIKRDDVK
ncbi:MAG: hypothetical protein RSC73_01680 [Ruthenibacterium sp.]